MAQTKPRGKYQGVTLPVPLIKEIKEHIMKNGKYKSIAEFIRESVREKMDVDRHPAFRPSPPSDLTEKEKEIDAFYREYIDEKFKVDFEERTAKVFHKLMKKQIVKGVKEEKKKKKETKNNFRG